MLCYSFRRTNANAAAPVLREEVFNSAFHLSPAVSEAAHTDTRTDPDDRCY